MNSVSTACGPGPLLSAALWLRRRAVLRRLADPCGDLGLLQPGPIGRLPILIGGNGERRTLRLVARHADMWNGYGDAATIRPKNDIIDRWCDEIGRDPREIERTVWIDKPEPELMRSLVEAGADHLILGLRAPYDLDQVKSLVAARLAF